MLGQSCTNRHEEITDVDWEAWKADRNGCLMKRALSRTELASQIDRLKSLSEMDIVGLMGRPDQTELYERNQKFYTYFVSPGPLCKSPDSSARRLTIRFNAMGLAKEVSLN
jgi:hypothetical protein